MTQHTEIPDLDTPAPHWAQHPVAVLHQRTAIAVTAAKLQPVVDGAKSFIAQDASCAPLATGVTVRTDYLEGFLAGYFADRGIPKPCIGTEVLVMELPERFESDIATIAVAIPEAFCHEDLDGLINHAYLGWSCEHGAPEQRDPTARRTEFWMIARTLQDVTTASGATCNDDRWVWAPVVILCGQSVAIGGFALNYVDTGCMQAAMMTEQSYDPRDVYSQQEMAAAAEKARRFGIAPWFNGIWQMDKFNVLGVRVLEFIGS